MHQSVELVIRDMVSLGVICNFFAISLKGSGTSGMPFAISFKSLISVWSIVLTGLG